MQSFAEQLPYGLMSLALVIVGAVYIRSIEVMQRVFACLPGPRLIRPALGAALAGFAGLGLYMLTDHNEQAQAVLSTGYGLLQTAVESPVETTTTLLSVAMIKILTTC